MMTALIDEAYAEAKRIVATWDEYAISLTLDPERQQAHVTVSYVSPEGVIGADHMSGWLLLEAHHAGVLGEWLIAYARTAKRRAEQGVAAGVAP